jgi:hypothetical protein
MAHLSKTVRGNVLRVLPIVAALLLVVIVATAQSGPLVWGGLVLVVFTCVTLYIWRRRVDHAREGAWVGASSVGDVVASMRARQALDSLGAMKGSGSSPAEG